MAEAIFRDLVTRDPELQSAGIEAKSAGTYDCIDGASASDNARAVMEEHGLDINFHTAQHINPDLMNWADIILVMKDEHKHYIAEHFPHTKEKVYLLTEFVEKEGDVPDPVGCGEEAYRECANLLESLLRIMMGKMK